MLRLDLYSKQAAGRVHRSSWLDCAHTHTHWQAPPERGPNRPACFQLCCTLHLMIFSPLQAALKEPNSKVLAGALAFVSCTTSHALGQLSTTYLLGLILHIVLELVHQVLQLLTSSLAFLLLQLMQKGQ